MTSSGLLPKNPPEPPVYRRTWGQKSGIHDLLRSSPDADLSVEVSGEGAGATALTGVWLCSSNWQALSLLYLSVNDQPQSPCFELWPLPPRAPSHTQVTVGASWGDMACWPQLRLLLWKNLTFRRRQTVILGFSGGCSHAFLHDFELGIGGGGRGSLLGFLKAIEWMWPP